MIIFGQGAIRSHPYIFQEMSALDEVDWNVSARKFDRALFEHILFFISKQWRSLFHRLTGSWFAHTGARGPVRRYYQKLTRFSAAFGLLTDVTILVLGASLKRREKISARLGDILSYMYLTTAVLRRVESQGKIKDDIPLMRWSCDLLLYKTQSAIDGLLQNYPNRALGWVLRFVIFPLGMWFKPPSDKLGHKVSELLLTPSQARNRLTQGVFIPSNQNDTVAKLEDTLVKVIKAEHIERKIRKTMKTYEPGYQVMDRMLEAAIKEGVINEEEATTLREAETARWEVVQVDDFDKQFKQE